MMCKRCLNRGVEFEIQGRALATIEDTEVMSFVFYLGLWYLDTYYYIYATVNLPFINDGYYKVKLTKTKVKLFNNKN